METAKLFKNGESQAVRLPKEFRFRGKEVYIKRQGNTVSVKSGFPRSFCRSLSMARRRARIRRETSRRSAFLSPPLRCLRTGKSRLKPTDGSAVTLSVEENRSDLWTLLSRPTL